jgi:hypothetical protein
MRVPSLLCISSLVLVSLAGCSADDGSGGSVDGGRRDARADARGSDAPGGPDVPIGPCTDMDNDGISDTFEQNADDDGDGVPNWSDDDSDGDGYTDIVESVGNYPNYASGRAPLTCGAAPDDCDSDGRFNFRDTDSDNDGLTDAEEAMVGSNPCASDSDGDGIDDLTERAAGSNPTDNSSMPPANTLYVTLPYHPPGDMGDHPTREFTFQTRIRSADIMFVIDTTGSMGTTISAVQDSLSTTIIPGIVAALGPMGDARYGIAAHGDFANGDAGGGSADRAMTLYQRLDANSSLSQMATTRLAATGGGDGPEAMVPAMHALISGHGLAGYGGTAVRDMMPGVDCPGTMDGSAPYYGWACFQEGRVPIMVLFSDADWHNGPSATSNFYTMVPGAAMYSDLEHEMVRRGAFFVGIDVGFGLTYANSDVLARATGTVDASGQTIRFQGDPSTIANSVVDAITRIAGQVRQDITTNTTPDPMETRIVAGHTTADFIPFIPGSTVNRMVTPTRGMPDAPTGYDRHDDTTFYNVAPSTQVVFTVTFYNDFQPGGSTASVYKATIHVLGRAGTEVDHRDVFIVVPADGGGLPG